MKRSPVRSVGVQLLAGALLSIGAASAYAAPTPTATPKPTAAPSAAASPSAAPSPAATPRTPSPSATRVATRRAEVQLTRPDFDDAHHQVRITAPAGVEFRVKLANGSLWNGGQVLRSATWEDMSGVVGQQITVVATSVDPAVVLTGTTEWPYTFYPRSTAPFTNGDEFEGPGIHSAWGVSSESWATGRSKGKSFFRPENAKLQDGKLKITSARHCVVQGEEPTAANQTSEVCPADKVTVYSSARFTTGNIMDSPGSMEVVAKLDESKGPHHGVTTTAWANNSEPFCQGAVRNSNTVEIDTMEIWNTDFTHNSTHTNCRDGKALNIGIRQPAPDGSISGEWHTFRMEWDGYAVRYFFDGQPVRLWKDPGSALTADVLATWAKRTAQKPDVPGQTITPMSKDEWVQAMTQYLWRISVYSAVNANGVWSGSVDDTKPWEARVDEFEYVRWHKFDLNAPHCVPRGMIAVAAGANAGQLGRHTSCERMTDIPGDLRAQEFEHGRIYLWPNGSTRTLLGPEFEATRANLGGLTGAAWDQQGGELGKPLEAETCSPEVAVIGPVWCQRKFANGVVVFKRPDTPVVNNNVYGNAYAVLGDIGRRYVEAGAYEGYGAPLANAVCTLKDGGCFQSFEKGMIYWSPKTGAHLVGGAIFQHWAELKFETGLLGYPVSSEICGLRDGGCVQHFQGGLMYWSPKTGAHFTRGAIFQKYGSLDWERGFLGYPVTDETCGLRDNGCVQIFQGGLMYWSAKSDAHFVRGAVYDKYASLGWEGGFLGYPVSDEICGLRDGGCVQLFRGGLLYWSPNTGTHFVRGAIYDRYAASGWEGGLFGYPVTDEICGLRDGGCYQRFQREDGHIYWSPASGAWSVQGAIFGHWASTGWEAGRLGYPVGGETCSDVNGARECVQQFQRGRVIWNSRFGTSG
ncbi:family 16 glycosylhydrolase [Naumannella sp. ID2617S]|nr:family 16 glycosylhydrolase [Naumannella sp. ID2617S]